MQFAIDWVPFYRKLYEELHLTADRIRSLADLAMFPIVDKKDLRTNFALIKPEGLPGLYEDHTSGSTSRPLVFFKWKGDDVRELAACLREHIQAGYRPGEKNIIIRGFEPKAGRARKFLRRFYANQKFVSSFALDEKKIDELAAYIRDKKPTLIAGWPSYLDSLGKYLVRTGQNVRVRSILSVGEMLSDELRKSLELSFKAEVFNAYGAGEAMYIASECRYHHGMHIDPSRFLIEIVDPEGNPVREGQGGDILVTYLEWHGTPFIRYKIGDIGALDRSACACGLSSPRLKHIEGRSAFAFVTPGGKRITFSTFNCRINPLAEFIDAFQIVVKKADDVILRIQLAPGRSPADVARLEPIFRDAFPDISFALEFVDSIPPGRTGKRLPMVTESGDDPGLSPEIH